MTAWQLRESAEDERGGAARTPRCRDKSKGKRELTSAFMATEFLPSDKLTVRSRN
jgi:hypothetical protein